MNLLEAIQGAGENWFREAGETGYGLSFDNTGELYKHSHRNGVFYSDQYHLNMIGEFRRQWEIVTPEQVLSERKL